MILSPADQEKIETFWNYCLKHQYFNIGYPESADFDYSALFRFSNSLLIIVVIGKTIVITH